MHICGARKLGCDRQSYDVARVYLVAHELDSPFCRGEWKNGACSVLLFDLHEIWIAASRPVPVLAEVTATLASAPPGPVVMSTVNGTPNNGSVTVVVTGAAAAVV